MYIFKNFASSKVIVSEMSKEFLVGWPALVRAGLGSEWERSRSRSDTIIDPSRRSLTTQTFPDTEPAPEPEPVSKVGARDSPPTTQLRSGPESKQRPVSGYQWGWPSGGQWRDTGCGQHWGRWDISDPGAVTSAGSLQCPHHCSSWSLGLAPCRAHWPVIFRSRQRSTKQEKNSLRYLDTDVLLSESKYSFGCFPPPFYVDFVPFGNLFACCLNILIWKRRNLATKSWNLFLSGTLCLSWSDLEDRWALVLGHVMQLLWGLAGGALHVMQCTIMVPVASTMTVSSVHVHRNTVSETVSSWYSPFQKKLVTSWPVTQPRDLRQCLTSARMVSYESAKVTLQSGIGLPSKAD